MQRTGIFIAQQPKIGLERVLYSNIFISNFYEIEESEKFDDSQIDSLYIENILNKNSANLNKYKADGVPCVYDERLYNDQICIINYQSLMSILAYDENAFENFIEKGKGKFVESLNEARAAINRNSTSSGSSNNQACYSSNAVSISNTPSNDDSNLNYRKNYFKAANQNLEIEFESRFESGNLRMALQITELEYDLILKNDINSGKTSNWFFFRFSITNAKKIKFSDKPITVKFNIINCQKNDTLFSKGLKVLYYRASINKWYRNTKNNYYYPNTLQIDDKRLHSLTFSIEINFDFEQENFYFCYCYPYTFSKLQNFLENNLNNQCIIQSNVVRHEVIGKSLAGNNLDMLIITKFESSFEEIAYRPCIILTARVHPGESNSSFVIQGLIEFLLDLTNPISENLRKNFIFKIVPMLNPDGVINGNFRTSLIGKDLNRLWDDPRENICPTIFYTKEMIKKTLLSRDIFLFCDFHGHSNKPNFFLYGCPSNKKVKINSSLNFQEMILSKIFYTKSDIFDSKSCIYKIVAKKLKTARAVLKNEFNIDLSYCLESSIGHITIGENKLDFFTPKFYEKIGKDFCLSVFELQDKNIFNEMLFKLQTEEISKGNSHANNINSSSTNSNSNNHLQFSKVLNMDENNTNSNYINNSNNNNSNDVYYSKYNNQGRSNFAKEKNYVNASKNNSNLIMSYTPSQDKLQNHNNNNISECKNAEGNSNNINVCLNNINNINTINNINILNNISSDKFKKKKNKLNPIKTKKMAKQIPIRPNESLNCINSNNNNNINSNITSNNVKILSLNTANSININININNINNNNSNAEKNILTLNSSGGDKFLLNNSYGVTNSNSGANLSHLRPNNYNIYNINNFASTQSNSENLGTLSLICKITKGNNIANNIITSINNSEEISQKLKNASFRLNDRQNTLSNIKDKIFLKTNSISAKLLSNSNSKTENIFSPFGSSHKRYNDMASKNSSSSKNLLNSLTKTLSLRNSSVTGSNNNNNNWNARSNFLCANNNLNLPGTVNMKMLTSNNYTTTPVNGSVRSSKDTKFIYLNKIKEKN